MDNMDKPEKVSVSLKKTTVNLLDDVARKKVRILMKNGSFDIIDLIRSRRGRGVSYDSQINFLARVYLAVMDETILNNENIDKEPQLKKVLDRLNKIHHFTANEDEDS